MISIKRLFVSTYVITLSLIAFLLLPVTVYAQSLGKGFYDHGVASPISNDRGIVATVDGNGKNVVLLWLFDHRGGYALLMIDAETGASQQFPMPFPAGDAVYSSILSSKNKFYTLFNSYFVEFDPVKRAFTYTKQASRQMAMGMFEDDHGAIWGVTYPNSGLVCFNPTSREFTDYGYLYKQNWLQYPTSLATDDKGWVYWAIGNTASQIMAFDPVTKEAKPILKDQYRKRGHAYVYRDRDGKVYGQGLQDDNTSWYEFYNGDAVKLAQHTNINAKPIITGNQNLYHHSFPDGSRIETVDLKNRKLTVWHTSTRSAKTVDIKYESDGAIVMGVIAAPNGVIVGGTTFPMRFFSFNPKTGAWTNLEAFGQFNALAKQNGHVYFGDYPSGGLLEWNPTLPWVNTHRGEQTNPQFLASANPLIHRPHRVLAYNDGKTIIMGGTPEYGYTGGGLLFWDRIKKQATVIPDSSIVLDQSTMSLASLPGGRLLGGTTVSPGTGGERKATEAEMYIMDITTKRIEWHEKVIPGALNYMDMCQGPNGLVYGVVDRKIFFVFDPLKHVVVHRQNVADAFGQTVAEQSPRIFVTGADGANYLLFIKGIAKIDPKNFELTLTEAPVPVNVGGDYLDGRIYFISGSHLCSYQVPAITTKAPKSAKP
jgi:hypothetical protein